MSDTRSTAATSPLVNTVIPVYIDGSPITDEGSIAYLDGALHQASLFYERTGHFESMWRHGVAVGSSKTAVDSIEAVYFAAGIVQDNSVDGYTFLKPCPPTTQRIPAYDRRALADRSPRFRSYQKYTKLAYTPD